MGARQTERFFCREAFEYSGAIHNRSRRARGEARRAHGPLRIASWLCPVAGRCHHKARRNIPILKRALAAYPNDEYFWFQLGKARYSLEEYAESVTALQEALRHMEFRGRCGAGKAGSGLA